MQTTEYIFEVLDGSGKKVPKNLRDSEKNTHNLKTSQAKNKSNHVKNDDKF